MTTEPKRPGQGVQFGPDHSGEFPAPDAVPASFAVQKPIKRAEPKVADPKTLEAMKNQEVIVDANGMTYRGMLQGSDGDELYLKTELRYTSVPLDRVVNVRLATAPQKPLEKGVVDASFFEPGDGEEG